MKGKKRERIIRILLTHPTDPLSLYRIAKLADCSHVWVYKFLRKMELLGLVKGTKVTDIEGLFSYWIKINPRPNYFEYNIQEPLKILKTTKLKYALTTYYAESLLQDYLFPSRVDIYIEEQFQQQWHELLVKRGLVGKGNFRVLVDDGHVFYKTKLIQGHTIVSIPQLIFDLLREKGVAFEAANMLMRRFYYGNL